MFFSLLIDQPSYYYLVIHHPLTLSFEALKPSFSANHSHRSPTFFFFRIHYMDSPRLFTVTSEHIRLYFFSFSVLHFLVVVTVRQIKLTHVCFRAHVKQHLVSYRDRGGNKNCDPNLVWHTQLNEHFQKTHTTKFGKLIFGKGIKIVVKMHQIRLRLALRPRPRWGSLQRTSWI